MRSQPLNCCPCASCCYTAPALSTCMQRCCARMRRLLLHAHQMQTLQIPRCAAVLLLHRCITHAHTQRRRLLQLLTSLGIQGAVVVHIGVAQRAARDGIAAHTDGCHRTNLQTMQLNNDVRQCTCLQEQGRWHGAVGAALLRPEQWLRPQPSTAVRLLCCSAVPVSCHLVDVKHTQ